MFIGIIVIVVDWCCVVFVMVVGIMVEWYDFFIYVIVVGFVFG